MVDSFCHGTNGGWEKFPDNPLLGGELGTCFDISMLQENGELSLYFSWRDCGSIALVTSADGIHWSKPVICLSPRESAEQWESVVNRPYVLHANGEYHMWYTGQAKPGEPDGQSYLFYAKSKDGIRFERVLEQPVMRPEAPWEKTAVMCPSVLWNAEKRRYEMWYSGGEQYEPDAFGYATSEDGVHWDRHPLNPVFGPNPEHAWEQHKVGGCQMQRMNGWYWMFYIGYHNEDYAQIGMARSRDGVTGWERSPLNPILAPDEGAWDGEACYKPFALPMGDGWRLWYNGRKGLKEQIGLAVHPGELKFE